MTCKRAKLRGRRARGDDFAHCALISLGDVRRDDGAAPWRAVEMIPPPRKGLRARRVGGARARVLRRRRRRRGGGAQVGSEDARARRGRDGELERERGARAAVAARGDAMAGARGGPARVEIGETPEKKTEPARDVGIGKTPEKRTPPRVAGGVFAEGRSPEGPLVEGVSFTPPAARSDGEDGDEFPETSARARRVAAQGGTGGGAASSRGKG